jgi:hypothetical protein
MLRLGGALHLTEGRVGWVLATPSGAVARRLHAAVTQLTAERPAVEVHEPTGLQPTRYRLLWSPSAPNALRTLGLLDRNGRPTERAPARMTAATHDAAAYVRGALMVATSVSDPRRPAHLEITTPSGATAAHVASLLARFGATGARSAQRTEGWRVFCKSGAEIGAVLARVGAHGAFLEWDGERLRRELRGEANRVTNADRANLSRSVDAAARQVAAIEAAVAALGWEGISDDLRETALTRLANRDASIAELAALHDPPVGKATVHRRLARLAKLTDPDR